MPESVGKYRLEARLSEGGMGEVWKAFDTELHRLPLPEVCGP